MATVHSDLLVAVASMLDVDGEIATYHPKVGGEVEIPVVLRPGSDEVADLYQTGARRPGYRVRIRQSDLAVRPVRGDLIDVRGLTLRVKYFEEDALEIFWRVNAYPTVPTLVSPATLGVLRPPLLVGTGWASL